MSANEPARKVSESTYSRCWSGYWRTAMATAWILIRQKNCCGPCHALRVSAVMGRISTGAMPRFPEVSPSPSSMDGAFRAVPLSQR